MGPKADLKPEYKNVLARSDSHVDMDFDIKFILISTY